jgi:hypothetical protein
VRGDLDRYFNQSISSLNEENIVDPDLGALCGFNLFYLYDSSIDFIVLVELESE